MPYVTQDKRVGLREPIDEQAAEMKKVLEGNPDRWQNETFKQMVEDDLVYLFRLAESNLDFGEGRGVLVGTPMPRVTRVLRARLADGQQIGGDMNFCTCRYLVGLTEIHLTPKYEDKIQWIQERIEAVKRRFATTGHFTGGIKPKTVLGILQCVSLELYRRYAIPYEDLKCFGYPGTGEDTWVAGNGDIMD